jgi:hypothetical protein
MRKVFCMEFCLLTTNRPRKLFNVSIRAMCNGNEEGMGENLERNQKEREREEIQE